VERAHLLVDRHQLGGLRLEELGLAPALAVKLEHESAEVEQERLADLSLAAQTAAHAAARERPRPVRVSAEQAHDGATIAWG
jgi:hypothetical protein